MRKTTEKGKTENKQLRSPLPSELRLPVISLMAHANEHRRPSGIMSDPVAFEWFESLSALYDGLPDIGPELIDGIIVRSMVIDYALLSLLAGRAWVHVTDLGCGFSTRGYRLACQIVKWTNVDLPLVVQARRTLGSHYHNLWERFVEVDLTDLTLPDFVIGQVEYTTNNCVFIAEGLLNHMSEHHAAALVRFLGRTYAGSWIIGTLMHQNALEPAQELSSKLGFGKAMWGFSDLTKVQDLLGIIKLTRIWLLGMAASQYGLERPKTLAQSSGIVFLAQLS
jgi:O-methyltransferase involved in polyketide biosynthesis